MQTEHINCRIPEDLVDAIERKRRQLADDQPWRRITRSDAIRALLRDAAKRMGEDTCADNVVECKETV